MKTNHPPAPDAVFPVVIHLPDGSTSKVKARVRRIATGTFGKGTGVELIERDANYLHFIRSLFHSGRTFANSRISIDPS